MMCFCARSGFEMQFGCRMMGFCARFGVLITTKEWMYSGRSLVGGKMGVNGHKIGLPGNDIYGIIP